MGFKNKVHEFFGIVTTYPHDLSSENILYTCNKNTRHREYIEWTKFWCWFTLFWSFVPFMHLPEIFYIVFLVVNIAIWYRISGKQEEARTRNLKNAKELIALRQDCEIRLRALDKEISKKERWAEKKGLINASTTYR